MGPIARIRTRSGLVAMVVVVFALLLLNPLTKRPWGCSYFTPGWYHTAQEINAIDAALVTLRTDASSESLLAFFDSKRLNESIQKRVLQGSLNAFEASAEVYTAVFTALLEHGRSALEELASSEKTRDLALVLNPEPLKKLRVQYHLVEGDSWGGGYSFFLGPWPQPWGPVVFRKYRVEQNAGPADLLTVEEVGDDKIVRKLGYPAHSAEEIYIWSPGPNGVSDQAVFDPSGTYEPPASLHYRADAPSEYLGGGDDINNWDPDMSWGHLHYMHLR